MADTPSGTTQLSPIGKAQLEAAFEAWENGFRIEPEKYRTVEETAGLSVSQLSTECADYFFELLLQTGGAA